MSQSLTLNGNEDVEGAEGDYERPQLTPIGNLHDLLAFESGSQCDEGHGPASGTDAGEC